MNVKSKSEFLRIIEASLWERGYDSTREAFLFGRVPHFMKQPTQRRCSCQGKNQEREVHGGNSDEDSSTTDVMELLAVAVVALCNLENIFCVSALHLK